VFPDFLKNLDPEIFLGDNYLVLDFETTGQDKGSAVHPDNEIILSSWYTPQKGLKRKVGSQYEQEELLEDIERADFLVAHNAKFELQWLRNCGVDLTKILAYCTQVGEFVRYGNQLAVRRNLQSLEHTSKRYGLPGKINLVSSMIKAGLVEDVPIEWLGEYCDYDVLLCLNIFLRQRKVLRSQGKLPVMYTRCLTMSVLADIEFSGLHLDAAKVELAYEDYVERARKVEQELDDMTGGINPRSPVQVAEFVYDVLGFEELKDRRGSPIRTDKDQRKADAKTLAKLKAKNKKQKRFLELKKEAAVVMAALSKNLEFFKGVVEEKGGLFYGNLNQTNVQTHRLSSSGRSTKFDMFPKAKSCQFQNLPRRFKPLFSSRKKGWLVGEVDGAQLEFRVAAFLGQDKVAVDSIQNKEDVHSFSASIIYNKTLEEIEKNKKTADPGQDMRTLSKEHTFKPLFGGTSGTPGQRRYYKAFNEKYSKIAEEQGSWVGKVLRDKKLTLASGLEMYWKDTKAYESGFVKNSQNIYNYPIQSLATAEIIPVALVYFWHRAKLEEAELLITNTIHDSIIVELPEEERQLFTDISREAFSTDLFNYLKVVYNIEWNVPLGMGIKCSSHWSEGEEYEETFEPPYKFEE